MPGWKIVRTKPFDRRYGRAIPVFIRNGNYHLASVDVYSDGAIDCWGFVDRTIFPSKVRSGWVSTQPPKGSVISIFSLGNSKVEDAHWIQSLEDIQQEVED